MLNSPILVVSCRQERGNKIMSSEHPILRLYLMEEIKTTNGLLTGCLSLSCHWLYSSSCEIFYLLHFFVLFLKLLSPFLPLLHKHIIMIVFYYLKLLLQVRDYRKCFPEVGQNAPSTTGCPIINRVCLKMSLENVVKDIPLISDSAWTYGDMMVSKINPS